MARASARALKMPADRFCYWHSAKPSLAAIRREDDIEMAAYEDRMDNLNDIYSEKGLRALMGQTKRSGRIVGYVSR